MEPPKHKRAPRGYRIERWADGAYHVYGPDGGCIDEALSKNEALSVAWTDKANRGKDRYILNPNDPPQGGSGVPK